MISPCVNYITNYIRNYFTNYGYNYLHNFAGAPPKADILLRPSNS